jgi:hypothetical protein
MKRKHGAGSKICEDQDPGKPQPRERFLAKLLGGSLKNHWLCQNTCRRSRTIYMPQEVIFSAVSKCGTVPTLATRIIGAQISAGGEVVSFVFNDSKFLWCMFWDDLRKALHLPEQTSIESCMMVPSRFFGWLPGDPWDVELLVVLP